MFSGVRVAQEGRSPWLTVLAAYASRRRIFAYSGSSPSPARPLRALTNLRTLDGDHKAAFIALPSPWGGLGGGGKNFLAAGQAIWGDAGWAGGRRPEPGGGLAPQEGGGFGSYAADGSFPQA